MVLIENPLDITVAFISTQIHWKEENDILLQPNKNNGLKKESLIRLSKLATLDKDLALGLLGNLTDTEIQLVNRNLRTLFKLN